jgi:hypothetical protein
VVPIFRSNGYAHLCVSGAVYDYPELDSVRQRLCTPAKRGGGVTTHISSNFGQPDSVDAFPVRA